MHVYLKDKPAWMQLIIFAGLTLGIALAASFIGLAIVAAANHVSLMELSSFGQSDFAKPQYAGIVRGLLVVQFFGVFLSPSLVFAYFADPRPLAFAGLKKPARLGFIFLGLIIILCSYLAVEWLAAVNQELVQNFLGKTAQRWIAQGESDVSGTLQNILTMNGPKDLLISILLVGVLAAIGEELFFRGILQRIFIHVFKSPWWGIIVTAAIFSAVHGQFLGFIPRMILGIILGALYWYSGSLYPAIAGHFVFNSLQVLLVYYKAAAINQTSSVGDKFLPVVGITALVIVTVLLNYLRRRSPITYASVYEVSENKQETEFLSDRDQQDKEQ